MEKRRDGMRSETSEIDVLLVEDNESDALLIREALSDCDRARFAVTLAHRLSEAIDRARANEYGVALLDLGLPDSQAVETFVKLHAAVKNLPVVVLTGLDDEATGTKAVQLGAQDYIVKRDISGIVLSRSIRYALERFRLSQKIDLARQDDAARQEMSSLESLAEKPGTQITAAMYASGSLRQRFPDGYERAVRRYRELLERALEQRSFRVQDTVTSAIEDLSDDLGVLRAGPRDVIEIHTSVLRACVANIAAPKAQAYLEEGRLTVLKLMGQLTTFYRQYYIDSRTRRMAE